MCRAPLRRAGAARPQPRVDQDQGTTIGAAGGDEACRLQYQCLEIALVAPMVRLSARAGHQLPNLVVLDWNSTPNRTNLGGDQMHYNTTGYRNRAAFIVEGLVAISCRPA